MATVVAETLERTELPSEDVLENVVDFFFLTKPIRSSSLGSFRAAIEGLRNSPFTDGRGFSEREDKVLLPGLIWLLDGWNGDPVTLGDVFVADAEVGDLMLRMLDGVLSGLRLVGRFTGV